MWSWMRRTTFEDPLVASAPSGKSTRRLLKGVSDPEMDSLKPRKTPLRYAEKAKPVPPVSTKRKDQYPCA